ncbi:D-isomer specific 2-hydroxyacid dehydrogenase family protein [Pseudothermotoga thermarum]|uniref:D-isomer specific 2-hydroxyacid dehydrogenase NAD-binding protein n=1 Tax=Pseudothermotoga thermarum DSM 5069 TaxID=688269 RepID=F7YVX4_9THEM|nr:D-isomer specific 2-hydroxyacid dehydrogenase family protein [Pseudothermotoga thermarum]AEH51798.1 D-isomer specific 2-hydroxyacid dehydrogenase NAD-binding protein [Pseudothermotoga thermarum DSM 5069]
MVKIAIVNSSSFGKYFPEHIEKLKKYGEVERFEFPENIDGKTLAEKLKGFSIIIASVKPYFNKEFFEHKDKTILIARHGIGYDNIDIKSATEKKVIVTKVTGTVEREAVAETAIALLMTVIRRIIEASTAVKQGRWRDRAKFMGWEIKGKTVGIIGFGNIGSRVGEILKNGFNVRLLAFDPNLSSEEIRKRGAEPCSLEELLRSSDIISLNASLTKENYHMLSYREFEMMKQNVIIINTARGELIDEKALMEYLNKGRVAGVGMDVVEGEPIDETHPLLKYENVVITPHIAAYTYECLKGMGDKVVEDVEKVMNKQIPNEVVNKEVIDLLLREGTWKI